METKVKKRIGLVAHDNRKNDLNEWVTWNHDVLVHHDLICTGTTGRLIEKTMVSAVTKQKCSEVKIKMLKSGPLGGDQQLGALISERKIDLLIFLWDPMQPQPHDVDVKALLRLAVLYNVPTACNRSSADFLISSPLLSGEYRIKQEDFSEYTKREIK